MAVELARGVTLETPQEAESFLKEEGRIGEDAMWAKLVSDIYEASQSRRTSSIK